MIEYIEQKNIDQYKWDQCINKAINGVIYAEYQYLTSMCPRWDALVFNNYEIVMPITWNRKYGIYYLYQPFFCASLGIFGNNINELIIKSFLESVPSKFRFWDIYLNRGNNFSIEQFPFYNRLNLILDLSKPFYALSGKYSGNHIKTISLAARQRLYVEKDISISMIITLARKQSKSYSPIKKFAYERFEKLFQIYYKNKKAVTYGTYNEQKQLLASAVFFISNSRAYYILVGNHPRGRNVGASHLLINEFIKDHSEKKMHLDFEGSNIESIARFYKGFGAVEEIYPGLKVNKLSPFLKLFRK